MERPTIVCLCGSTKFTDWFRRMNLIETLQGHIVLSIGCESASDAELFGAMRPDEWEETKTRLDTLHKAKIDLADQVLILNVGDYIGMSTQGELTHARAHQKTVLWLEPSRWAQADEAVYSWDDDAAVAAVREGRSDIS